MMEDMGVTIMEQVGSPLYITRDVPEHTMDYKQTIPQILKVANNSGFCFRLMGLLLGADHLTWRRGGGVMVFCFVPNFFFGQHKS
jgi:hypothetical protein